MHKDPDLDGNVDYAKHSRNSSRGKAGVNRAKRHRIKQVVSHGETDATAVPASPKEKKRFGIKQGKFCHWYKTEKARDQALADMLKAQRIFQQTYGSNKGWASSSLSRPCTKIER